MAVVLSCAFLRSAAGEDATLILKDGRALTGLFAEVGGVAESALSPTKTAGGVSDIQAVIVVDDGLRRTFVHHTQVQQLVPGEANPMVRIRLWQNAADRGGGIGKVGPALKVDPFDQFGRRVYRLRTTDGELAVVQGITQITPVYTKVEGLVGGNRPIVWDQRIDTNSIPRDVLSRILATALKQDDVDERLEAVRLYLQSERYRDAYEELAEIAKQFPERKDLNDQVRSLRQLSAKSLLKEIGFRAAAGQHQLARTYLSQFPTEGAAGETLQEVRERLDKYAQEDRRRDDLLKQLNTQIGSISDDNGRRLAQQFAQEITAEINEETIARLATFERLASDGSLKPDQKVALAISGWLVGAAKAIDSFQKALSLAEVRDRVRIYLRDPAGAVREHARAELHDAEVATADNVAQILKLMKPPLDIPKEAYRGPRMFELTVPGLQGQGDPARADTRYVIQLPPEYDPLRHYPTIVALADSGVTPEQMLDFWAGPANKDTGERIGQAMRHGYIVLAVDWRESGQLQYNYSAPEHLAVLSSLRDACRRFAIDVDRVFLTGHGTGGDAAFDIALAHPDLWAGIMPINGLAERYCARYWPNGEGLSWYVVCGELDGDKLTRNAKAVLDRFMKPGDDLTVVEYLGRGYDPFNDEIQRLFDWMGRPARHRKMPQDFEFVTMRPWDNFFWWVEVDGLPDRSLVMPSTWPPPGGLRPFTFKSTLTANGNVTVGARCDSVTVWLAPRWSNSTSPSPSS